MLDPASNTGGSEIRVGFEYSARRNRKEMTMRLWIDDERPMPEGYTHHVYTSDEAIEEIATALRLGDPIELVSFDHDLGYSWEDGHDLVDGGVRDDTSRPVLLWMIENDIWPAEIRIHTANPVGHEWLTGMVARYGPYSA
jgi:hypothetical protein